MKLFPSVACPLPAVVTEKFAGFPSAEQFKCGLHCCKFRKALHLLPAKETGDFFIYYFWTLAGDDDDQFQFKRVCLNTSVIMIFSFLACDLLIMLNNQC